MGPQAVPFYKISLRQTSGRKPCSIYLLVTHLSTVLLELPVPVVQRADLARLEPSRDAVEVERMLVDVSHVWRTVRHALTLQMPQATVHSSLVAEAWFAWHSMQRSMMWLRQMAQLSTTMSQAQRATAFHCDMLALPRDDLPE
jgi:hypothetical protein